MRNAVLSSLVVVVFTGCAAVEPVRPPHVGSTPPTPICKPPRQCEAMWLAARDAAELISGMRIRMMNDSVIETFSARPPAPTVTVVKQPFSDGQYQIQPRFSCGARECDTDLRVSSVRLFNRLVTDAGMRFE